MNKILVLQQLYDILYSSCSIHDVIRMLTCNHGCDVMSEQFPVYVTNQAERHAIHAFEYDFRLKSFRFIA